MATNLTDIFHRRLMLGLSADQGATLIDTVADIAAVEAGWDSGEKTRQIADLRDYNLRLRPEASGN